MGLSGSPVGKLTENREGVSEPVGQCRIDLILDRAA